MLYKVKLRYVVEETLYVEAPDRAEAVFKAWGGDGEQVDWERIRNFVPKTKCIRSEVNNG